MLGSSLRWRLDFLDLGGWIRAGRVWGVEYTMGICDGWF